ncbi:MAG: 2-oxo acid dehydrogenase subunit E2 [Caldilineaceae bacterium]|nr:2-oxo acid dehydrogenase subunit E2 [Caldilineaceae bacterium]
MATAVVMPKQGQSVESCIIVEWKKQPGDTIAEGDVLCEVETDKAVLEVPSPVSGTLLEHFFAAGDDVPVLTAIAAVGNVGEDVSDLRPANASTQAVSAPAPDQPSALATSAPVTSTTPASTASTSAVGISPRARNLAKRKQVEIARIQGSGPGGRIIERDIQAALTSQPKVSPVAKAMAATGEFAIPDQGSGPGGRIMARDLTSPTTAPTIQAAPPSMSAPLLQEGESESIPIRGVRKVIAERMLHSLQSTAQLTLHSSADARALLALRKRLKASDPALGLQGVTINDLVLFAVARVIPQHPLLNATLSEGTMTQYHDLHLGFAVDTPRGLLVPVIRQANRLSLRALAQESKRLIAAIQAGNIQPDEMAGGTFTVTNLGSLGIEQFTPILNVPQVAILGVGSVNLKAVEVDDEVEFVPHIGLSLTINHQVVDGAPGARFLQALGAGMKDMDLLLAL